MLLPAIILALIQGFTEFLPISSSAHLVLVRSFAEWQDQGLAFDVSVHLGSLGALLLYFRQDLHTLLSGGLTSLRSGEMNADSRVLMMLSMATLPIIAVGGCVVLLGMDDYLRNPLVVAIANLVFAPLLLFADRCRGEAGMASLNVKHALLIGGCQAFAVLPGASRSGVTMMAALMLGYSRVQATRIAMLLAIPSILGAALLTLTAAIKADSLPAFGLLATGTCISFIAAYASIALLVNLVGRIGMTPFVAYRVILGIALLALLLRA